jgi:muramoyltetrapeptide carboxypeptidase
MSQAIIPPPLAHGSRIGICSTARKVTEEEVAQVAAMLGAEGFEVVIPEGLFAQENQFAGSDGHRAAELQRLLDDPTIGAVLFARGGYGTVRMIDLMDWTGLMRHPKWLCGFSDVTVVHSHVQRQLGIATVHSDMIPQFIKKGADNISFPSLMAALRGRPVPVTSEAHPLNVQGVGRGPLVGGNLSILYSLLGSPSDMDTDGRILFIEDLDEYLYHVDRMMMNLLRNGRLRNLTGLVVGGLSDMHDNPVPFGMDAEHIILSYARDLGIPVCFGMPIGHIDRNVAVAVGMEYELKVDGNGASLSPAL